MSSADNTGLGLFDDTASAAGNFPAALRGYDRQAVDDYVRTLEASVVQSRRHAAQLEQQVGTLQDRLTESEGKQTSPEDVDYSNLGGRANDILRLAEEQARDLTENASVEAEKIKEQARREADDLRNRAARDGDAIKSGGVAEIDQLRVRLSDEVVAQVEKAKEEAAALVAAARREAEALGRQSEHEAQTVRQNAYLDTENLRRSVDREAADVRQQIAVEREGALAQLKAAHEEATTKTTALLSEATKHNAESTQRLEVDIAEAARIRAEAVDEAERIKVAAAKESGDRIATATKQATAISERTQQEFSWRKQQLRRETELLSQRKQAVLSQLASLSALAQQTAHAFPDLDDLTSSDLQAAEEDDDELGDQTVLMPADAPAAVPPGRKPQPNPVDAESGAEQVAPGAGTAGPADVAVDGDATVLVAPGDLPAGTEHLHGGPKS